MNRIKYYFQDGKAVIEENIVVLYESFGEENCSVNGTDNYVLCDGDTNVHAELSSIQVMSKQINPHRYCLVDYDGNAHCYNSASQQ